MRFPTIELKPADNAPFRAEILPPPGAGESEANSSTNSHKSIDTSLPFFLNLYSIILCSISNFDISLNPRLCTAILTISSSDTPVEAPCFIK